MKAPTASPATASSALQSAGASWRLALMIPVGLSLLLLVLGALSLGRYPVRVGTVVGVLLRASAPGLRVASSTEATVVLAVRLPRVLTAALVGAGLAVSGAGMQGLFRNPLVSPAILGVSSGAGLGAAIAILALGPGAWLVQALAFVFGLAAVLAAWLISRGRTVDGSLLMLVLAGVIVSALCTALTSLIKYVADPENTLPAIVYWLMGSLAGSTTSSLARVALPLLVGSTALILMRWRINLLSLGEEEAGALGIDTRASRWIVIVLSTMVTASAVSAAGVVGWVGLVVPHVARMLVGPDHRRMLPVAAMIGGSYLVVIDTVARTATAAEIPLGILTAVVGAPFFAFLLRRTGGRW